MDFFSDFGTGNSTPGLHWLPGICAFLIVGTPLYHVLGFRLLRSALLKTYSQRSWWTYLKTYRGMLCQDVQTELQYISIVAFHHLLGGGLMAYGTCFGSPSAWAAGALIGCLDDVHDSLCMLLPAWPFGGDKRDFKFIIIMLIHHSAAIMSTLPVLCTGYHKNPHVQSIGAWLLLAGGLSHCTLALSRTCNRSVASEAKLDALIWTLGGAFYVYSRLWCFPRSISAIFREEYAEMDVGMKFALISFTGLMGLFNILIFLDVLKNVVKRIKLVFASAKRK